MKLWLGTCEAYGQTPYGFYAAENEQEALIKYKKDLKWQGTDYYEISVDSVEFVEDYKVKLL